MSSSEALPYLDEGVQGLVILGLEGCLDLGHVHFSPGHHDTVQGVFVRPQTFHGAVQSVGKEGSWLLAAGNCRVKIDILIAAPTKILYRLYIGLPMKIPPSVSPPS